MSRKLWALAALLVLMIPSFAQAQDAGRVRDFVLFNGSSPVDSTRRSSPWIPVKGAHRIVIRTWTTHAAFTAVNTTTWPSATDADSTFSDSIATWETLLSDSVSFIARDSAGTTVTSSSQIPTTTSHGEPYPICADSIMFTNNLADSSISQVGIFHAAVNRVLRAPANGSGRLTHIHTTVPNSTMTICGDCTLGKGYLKVTITPGRRMTAPTSGQATGGSRVQGLKGLRMVATVYYRTH
jgi:hypothetical protein